MADPWAILLVHFSDDDTEPFEKSWYEELFTRAGAGKWGLYDWFRDNSHGRADLTGSKVFGWYKLDMKASEYTGSGENQKGRRDLIRAAKQKARDAGVAVDDFVGTVVVLNTGADLFGGSEGAVGGDDGADEALSGLAVGVQAQEMCHVYGLKHSKQLGSPDLEYGDPWDMMSGLTPFASANPTLPAVTPRGDSVYPIGPGLNAANMWSRGWLDESRTWVPAGESVSEEIQLRPLHRRDLDGYLAARFADLLIEFRVPERWDAGIPRACVLVHEFNEGCSWLVADSSGKFEWTAGSRSGIDGFPSSPPPGIDLGTVRFSVDQIDVEAQTATLTLVRRPGRGAEQYFPEWWPKKRQPWLEERVTYGDSLLITPTDVLRIPETSVLRGVIDGISLANRSVDGTEVQRLGRVIDAADTVVFHSPRSQGPR
ncbi:hypothetical protein [Mumia zhuanghuii]|uniref:Uncharacterized protein n=1 Tax=Mumia zhuanghuii TaxID=2585211 RepID=A0A5C4MI68_9ACTN|nr:hypothetical protein [Mumia zhuanghuii]TNC44657.1 hypothetical protein FHE65_16530 [Mumia zhuanghuii]TNC51027.1 hypothetical protein FHE65_02325 [Mumia zhuanghuii]